MKTPLNRRIPILILADCEPDSRHTIPGHLERWIGYERLYEFLSLWREKIAELTQAPARFSWFWRMDPQIEVTYGDVSWPTRIYAPQIAQSERWGDDIGLHTHAWRWDSGLDRWIADHGDPAWVELCLRKSFAAFKRSLGRPCRIFRFGDGWLDSASVRLIEELGVHIDLTLEPGHGATPSLVRSELTTGLIPDRRSVPRYPYHPSSTDFRAIDQSGQSKLWMFPVTTGRLPWHALSLRPHNIVTRLAAPHRFTLQLNLGLGPEQFRLLFEQAASLKQNSYIAICVRTDVGSNIGLLKNVEENLGHILGHPLADQFVFTTPTDAIVQLHDQPYS